MEMQLCRQIQLMVLEIAKEIKRICDDNDIRYFLVDRTLLGAVRQQGFLPGEHTMQIGMLRRDYQRFCRIAPEKLDSRYCLQNWYTDPNYGLPYGRVRKRNTLCLEETDSRQLQEKGFYVCVFPFDHAPEDPFAQQEQARRLRSICCTKLMKSDYAPWREEGRIRWHKRLGCLYYQVQALFVSQKELAKAYDALAVASHPGLLVYSQEAAAKPVYYQREWMQPLTDCTFEGEIFKAPRHNDELLKAVEDQRKKCGKIVALDFGKEAAQ